jgi:hypothetical protein
LALYSCISKSDTCGFVAGIEQSEHESLLSFLGEQSNSILQWRMYNKITTLITVKHLLWVLFVRDARLRRSWNDPSSKHHSGTSMSLSFTYKLLITYVHLHFHQQFPRSSHHLPLPQPPNLARSTTLQLVPFVSSYSRPQATSPGPTSRAQSTHLD